MNYAIFLKTGIEVILFVKMRYECMEEKAYPL